jgi:thymidylate synthase
MIHVCTNNVNAAWREALKRLFQEGGETDNQLYFRDEMAVFELLRPAIEAPDPLFPMAAEDLAIINNFITTGANEDSVCHEWTKMYYHRINDEPNGQVKYMLEVLRDPEPMTPAVASLWDKTIDQHQLVAPCTMVIWGRRRGTDLELHVHAHSSDAYKKLLMNLQEFISLHHWLAAQLGLEVGKYIHVLDSCHIHREDEAASRELVRKL